MTDIAALIERLEKADRPDDEANTLLMEIYDPSFADSTLRQAMPFTSSIDAALALVEKKLPGWQTDAHTADGSPETYPIRKDIRLYDDQTCEVELFYCHPSIEPRHIGTGYFDWPAISICLALLRALQAQEPRHDD